MSLRLCLNTIKLLKGDNPFEMLHLVKTAQGVTFHEETIDSKDILGSKADETSKTITDEFLHRKIKLKKSEYEEQYHKMHLTMDKDEYVFNHLLKHYYTVFNKLKQKQAEISCYCRHKSNQGSIRTFPVKILPHELNLNFEVIKDEHGVFGLKPHFYYAGELLRSEDVEIFQFLVLSQNQLFILKERDWLKLEALKSPKMMQYGTKAIDFSQHVLQDIEKMYNVERHDFFPSIKVESEPTMALLFSETGGFLIIHPRFYYEGIAIEGKFTPHVTVYKNGLKYIIHRNEASETALLALFISKYADFKNQRTGHYFISVENAKKKNWFLQFYHSLLELDVEILGIDMLHNFRYSKYPIRSEYKVLEVLDNGMKIEFISKFGDEKLDNKELQKILVSKQRSIMLSDNTIGVLDEEWIEKFALFIKHSKVSGDILSIPKWVLVLQRTIFDDEEDVNQIIERVWWDEWAMYQNSEQILYPISDQIKATLRPYQQKGFEWMVLLSKIGAGACLADDMGLGKTLQTICFLDYQIRHGYQKKALIIAPTSLMYNWKQEIEKFAPHLTVGIYHSSSRDLEKIAEQNVDIFITSYGTARVDIDLLNTIVWNTIILDESHNIKNPSALVTKAIQTLHAEMKIVLSGTPIMNNTIDLYSQLSFILPNLFSTKDFFVKEYSDPIDKDGDKEKVALLKKVTHPFILRRTKEQVAKDLPPKVESIIWCEMGASQKAIYNEIKNNIKSSLFLQIKEDGLSKSHMSVLAGIQKLRQVCSSPRLLTEYENRTDESIKIDTVVEEIQGNLSQNKIIIFSQFLNVLDVLKEKLLEQNIAFYHIDGSTPEKKRQEQINLFQTKENPVRIFLLSLKAGNAGITLTEANYVFLIDPWWNRQVEQQAIDRVYRIGQDKSVFAYRMICKDTIEEKIIELQQKKVQLSEELIKEDEGFIKSLSENDINFLFE